MQRRYLRIMEMVHLVAISVYMLLMISSHHANAHFSERLKAMLDKPTQHLEKASNSQFTIKQRLRRASPDYDSDDNDYVDDNDTENSTTNFAYIDLYPELENCPMSLKFQLDEIYYESYTGPGEALLQLFISMDLLISIANNPALD